MNRPAHIERKLQSIIMEYPLNGVRESSDHKWLGVEEYIPVGVG
jgi:hypothetical protein